MRYNADMEETPETETTEEARKRFILEIEKAKEEAAKDGRPYFFKVNPSDPHEVGLTADELIDEVRTESDFGNFVLERFIDFENANPETAEDYYSD